MLSLGTRCCCDFRSLAILAMLSLGTSCCHSRYILVLLYHGSLVLYAAAIAVYLLLSWCLGALCCCCCHHSLAVMVMLSQGAHCFCCCYPTMLYVLLVLLHCEVRFCRHCRSFVVLMALYRVNLALSAAGVVIWTFWFVLCCVDVPIAEAQH
ncbi:hypothetical protein MAM1_0886d11338 [Mucor ambiguus]|uniref:Uncharacterized protein n=1 Tax=Mucor ambiguus TaxID=91626 RepID=A0A0C9N6S4_9FUNG|nr:hypothetical protein MAM1_0886d11338 [Mucor ambiguus]